jgi:hypothetical protein
MTGNRTDEGWQLRNIEPSDYGTHTVLFMQEHLLSESESALVVNIDSGFLCAAVFGFDNSRFYWRSLMEAVPF